MYWYLLHLAEVWSRLHCSKFAG